MKRLIGKTIEKILIDKLDGEHFIKFITDDGDFLYQAEGDCCSEAWFADIIGVKDALGSKVLDVEDIEQSDSSDEDNRTRQEYDLIYSVKIHHTNGILDVIFRNSSNGYYYGWYNFIENGEAITIIYPEKFNYDVYHDIEVEMFEITEDFMA